MKKWVYVVIAAVFMLSILGVSDTGSAAKETWVSEKPSATSFRLKDLTAVITVKIKNNDNNVQYFKIGQVYQGSLSENSTIKWLIQWTNPAAVKMVKSRTPELGGDYGWKVKPGETKTVSFGLRATGDMGEIPTYIVNVESDDSNYWPLINEPGLMSSWFMPNEIEVLNPSLDLRYWKGTFGFTLINIDEEKVSGIVRAPISPANSKLIYSSPKAFVDDDLFVSTQVAAWDVTMDPETSQRFVYTYEWPAKVSGGNGSTSGGGYYPPGSLQGTTGSSSVPGAKTGAPYAPLVIGVLVTAAAVAYTRIIR
ncbi:hypothetical protein [Methanothermobacter sp. K4]|uniref:hypothetical protein n=1 Tax=Methanothermobacter sp. K4 TaxID=2913262 RepID=UPI001EDAEBD7|nr:hypothetical protein [Methanothermobacter sp. K4]MCG2828303.1 hypothetical protein [Methanothermobacter sp. K4]